MNLSNTALNKLAAGCTLGLVLSAALFLRPLSPTPSATAPEGTLTLLVYPPDTKVYKRAAISEKTPLSAVGEANTPIFLEDLFGGPDVPEHLTLVFKREGFVELERQFDGLNKVRGLTQKSHWPPDKALTLQAESTLSSLSVRTAARPLTLLSTLLFLLCAGAVAVQRKFKAQRADALEKLKANSGGDPYIGAAIKEFRITKKLGHGGMANVYLAVPDHLFATPAAEKAAVAVKICTNLETQSVERFYQELDAAKELDHPNVIRVFEKGRLEGDDESPYLIMEYLSGRTLHSIVTEQVPALDEDGQPLRKDDGEPVTTDRYLVFEPMQIIAHLGPVVEALAHAHQRNVIHRDLTPANIMVLDDGTTKILDFGLSKIMGNRNLTMSGQVLGTPMYMSQEQVFQSKDVSHSTDQFALGCLIYRMLTGGHPYSDELMTIISNLTQRKDPQPIADIKPDCDPQTAKVVERMIAANAEQRFDSITDAFEAFCKAVEEAPV